MGGGLSLVELVHLEHWVLGHGALGEAFGGFGKRWSMVYTSVYIFKLSLYVEVSI
jgi:hypothetical protein